MCYFESISEPYQALTKVQSVYKFIGKQDAPETIISAQLLVKNSFVAQRVAQS